MSYKDGNGMVIADETVSEEDLLKAIKKAGPYSGTIKKRDKSE